MRLQPRMIFMGGASAIVVLRMAVACGGSDAEEPGPLTNIDGGGDVTSSPDPLGDGGSPETRVGDRFGLFVAQPFTQAVLAFPLREVAPYLRGVGFNHVVTAWREPPDAGDAGSSDGGPTAYMAINGGMGEVFTPGDASFDASRYVDAAPDEAGNLSVPYRGYSSRRWANGEPVLALRLGAPTETSTLDGTIDDVVVWDRILTFAEMAEVYAARAPLGDVCRLKSRAAP